MSRGAALWALAFAHSDPARAPEDLVAHLGPLGAWRARRRVSRAVARADAALGEQAQADRGHRLRLAFLFAAGRAPAGPGALDHGVVWAQFASLDPGRLLGSPPRARTALWLAGLAALLALGALVGGGLALYGALAPTPPRHFAPVPPPPPPSADERLGEAMTAWMIALDAVSATPQGPASRRELTKARAALDREAAGLGADVARAMGALLAESERLVASTGDMDGDEAALAAHVRDLNAACDAARQHYYVDGVLAEVVDTGRRRVYVSLFVIEESRRWASEPAPIRAVRVRRLDRVGFWKTLVGYTSPEIPEAVVLLDQADEELLSRLLPVLAPAGTFPLVDPDGPHAAAPWSGTGELAVSEALRAELGALPRLDRAAAASLGEILLSQRVLVDQWQARLEQAGSGLKMPWRNPLDLARLEWLRAEVDDFAQLEALQTRLREPRLREAWQTLDVAFLASIERHEVQHRWDFEHPDRPRALAAFTRAGVPRARGGEGQALEERAGDEVSAYLAQIATAPLPRAMLAGLASAVLEDPGWITAEARAGVVLFLALERALGTTPVAPLVERGQVLHENVVASLRRLLAVPPDALQVAARSAWQTLQRQPLPALAPP